MRPAVLRHAEMIAHALHGAVRTDRRAWDDLRSWEQQDYRDAAVTLIRSYDEVVCRLAHTEASDALRAACLPYAIPRYIAQRALAPALEAYRTRLAHGVVARREETSR